MNIAILGAGFDPSHNGHLKIARGVLQTHPERSRRINKVILMPVNIHPFGKKMASLKHRLKMAKLLEEKNIEVSDLELKKQSTSYTIETLQALKEKFPKDKFYWIIGSDNLKSFTKWKDWEKIINDFGLIIVARDNHTNIKNKFEKITNYSINENIIILDAKDFKPIDISSSEIKKKVRERKKISGLMPKSVEKYIIDHKLYL